MSIFVGSQGATVAWRKATCRQRIKLVAWYGFLWGALSPVVIVGGLVGIMWVLGSSIDHVAAERAAHDRCLKQATNGYEIKQCR